MNQTQKLIGIAIFLVSSLIPVELCAAGLTYKGPDNGNLGTLDFGPVPSGRIVTETIKIKNTNSAAQGKISVSKPAFTGVADGFVITSLVTDSNSNPYNGTDTYLLGVGETLSVSIKFSPSNEQTNYSAALSIGSSSPKSIPVTGEGDVVVVQLQDGVGSAITTPLNFGPVQVGQLSLPTTAKVVNIQSLGTSETTVNIPSFSDPVFKLSVPVSAQNVGGSESVTYLLQYAPTSLNSVTTGKMTISTGEQDAYGTRISPLTIDLQASIIAPQVHLSASSPLDMGSGLAGISVPNQTVTVTNTGAANTTLHIKNVTLSPSSGPFKLLNSPPISFPHSGDLDIIIGYTPPTALTPKPPYLAALQIETDDPVTPNISLNLTGGRTVGPAIGTIPTSGTTLKLAALISEQAFATFSVVNNGDAPLTVDGMEIGGTDPSKFTLINPPTIASPLILQPGISASFFVGFITNDGQPGSAVLTIHSNDPRANGSVSLKLEGEKTGLDPNFRVSDGTTEGLNFSFGADQKIIVGKESTPKIFYVYNEESPNRVLDGPDVNTNKRATLLTSVTVSAAISRHFRLYPEGVVTHANSQTIYTYAIPDGGIQALGLIFKPEETRNPDQSIVDSLNLAGSLEIDTNILNNPGLKHRSFPIMAAAKMPPPFADLVPVWQTGVTFSTSGKITTYSGGVTITNNGNGPSVACLAKVYLSLDATLDSQDIYVALLQVPALPAIGAANNANTKFFPVKAKTPANLSGHYLIATVDTTNQVNEEYRENNNVKESNSF